MALLDFHPGRSLSGALLSLLEIHPAALFGGALDRREARRLDEALAAMPSHLLDDIGMTHEGKAPPGEDLGRTVSMTAALRT